MFVEPESFDICVVLEKVVELDCRLKRRGRFGVTLLYVIHDTLVQGR